MVLGLYHNRSTVVFVGVGLVSSGGRCTRAGCSRRHQQSAKQNCFQQSRSRGPTGAGRKNLASSWEMCCWRCECPPFKRVRQSHRVFRWDMRLRDNGANRGSRLSKYTRKKLQLVDFSAGAEIQPFRLCPAAFHVSIGACSEELWCCTVAGPQQ